MKDPGHLGKEDIRYVALGMLAEKILTGQGRISKHI